MARRTGNKWNVNEILSLQREYELLEWDIQQIAQKHERTIDSILFKLYKENMIEEFHLARGYSKYYKTVKNNNLLEEEEEDEEEDDEEEEEEEDEEEEEEEAQQPDNISTSENTSPFLDYSQLENRVNNIEESICDIKYILTKLLKGSTKKEKLRKKNHKFSKNNVEY